VTTFSAIADSEIDPESPGTTSLFTKLRNNHLAQAEGDATAPDIEWAAIVNTAIGQSDIAANSIGQSELKQTTASQSISVSASSWDDISPTGGVNTLAYFLGANEDPVSGPTDYRAIIGHGGTYAATVRVGNFEANARTCYLYSGYVQASPPYRLDDVVPSFIYALVDNNNGDILGTSAALDPSWAYHGPTDIAAKWIDAQRRAWRKEKAWKAAMYNGQGQNPYDLIDAGQFNAAMALMENNTLVDFQITDAIKNRDMGLHPHPFMNQDLTGKTVIMLDPTSTFCIDMMEFIIDGYSEIPKLLHNKDILFGTTPLPRTMPNGVIAVNPRWR